MFIMFENVYVCVFVCFRLEKILTNTLVFQEDILPDKKYNVLSEILNKIILFKFLEKLRIS